MFLSVKRTLALFSFFAFSSNKSSLTTPLNGNFKHGQLYEV
jgi:hypothetical protein